MEIGVCAGFYGLRSHSRRPDRPAEDGMTIEDVVRHLAEIGWCNIELDVSHTIEAIARGGEKRLLALRRLCGDLGIKIWQLHVGEMAPGDQQACVGFIRHAEVLGISCIVLHPGASGSYTQPSERSALMEEEAEFLGPLAEHASRCGVKLTLENLMTKGGGRRIGEDLADLRELIRTVGSPHLGICLDTSHANANGLDVAQAVYACGDLLWATHISGNTGEGDGHRLPYNGSYHYYSSSRIDWIGVLEALRKIEYDGLLSLEIPGEAVAPLPVRDLKLEYARKLFAWLLDQRKSTL
jgi:sugar phosphate isomerase/epimerase